MYPTCRAGTNGRRGGGAMRGLAQSPLTFALGVTVEAATRWRYDVSLSAKQSTARDLVARGLGYKIQGALRPR